MRILSKSHHYFFVFCFILIAHISKAQYWHPVAGQIPGAQYTGIASVVSSPAIVVTTLNAGIYRSIDSGNSWQHVYVLQDSIYSLVNLDGRHLCAGGKGFTYTSSDSGITWTTNPFPFDVAIGRLVFHPSGALIAGTGSKWDVSGNSVGKGVWFSLDTGQTWFPINTGITKQDPLIEALAVTPSGIILAGIFDTNVGLAGKYGVMKLDSLQGTWHRLPITVNAPFNQHYADQGLRIESVFNINMIDGQVLASIEGVFVNFGYAFTIQKAVQGIGDTSIAWNVKWAIDSIPSLSSYYEHIVNVFKDSHDTIWASVSDAGNEINNNIYTGEIGNAIAWNPNMDSISQQTGRFLFSECANGQLYAVSYYTGNLVFVRSISGVTALPEIENNQNNNLHIFPNPTSGNLTIAFNTYLEDATVKIFSSSGKEIYCQIFSNVSNFKSDFALKMAPGIYFVSVTVGKETWTQKFVKE